MNIMATIFDFNGSRRLGRVKIYTKGVVRGEGGRGVKSFLSFPTPTPPHHTDSKSKMAGRTNDHELLVLACTNKTLALQATVTAPKMFLPL